ncbi:MAG: hypothetical protein IT368_09870, partial [Candidatus Hydrogenedentes bacterium]|nr:hypothetical protein [Candidatus Hydrogenedentota bacterium]
MNELVRQCLQALWKHRVFIVAITLVVGAIVAVREVLFTDSYIADTVLVVTDLTGSGDAATLVPTAFNPKIYEQLVSSTAVLGSVLDRLEKEGKFEEDPPVLEAFRGMVDVEITTIDETTRPVNYSPLIKLSARADTAELAGVIVDTWARIAIEQAQQAIRLQVAAVSETLTGQRQSYEEDLETVWQQLERETSEYNLEVLQQELNAKVELLNELNSTRSHSQRELQINEKKLATLQDSLLQEVLAQQADYQQQVNTLTGQLADEKSAFNTEILHLELQAQLELERDLILKRVTAERDLASAQERLVKVQGAIAQEKPYVELAKAPTDAAFWIVEGENSKTLTDLEDKVMVTQEQNALYWDLRSQEQELLSEIASRQAEITAIVQQLLDADAEQTATQELFASHESTQDQLRLEIDIGKKRYDVVATTDLLGLRKSQRETLLEIAQREADLTSITEQIEMVNVEKKMLQASIAEHTRVQNRLKKLENIATEVFTDIATNESFVTAAATLAKGQAGDLQTVGLNRL